MGFKNIMDMHTHTDNSFDGNHSIMYMCENACKKKVKAIAFTDHVEMDCFYEEHFDKVVTQAYFETVKARTVFKGKLIVCSGIEMGEATYNKKLSEKIIKEKNYDIIVASIHNLRNEDDFCLLDYSEYNVNELLNEYFDELCQLAEWGKFSTLAHLTYPLRYIVGENDIPVDLSKYSKQIDEILSLLAQKDRALEINTSGLFQDLGTTMPTKDIVKRFKDLGGKFITVGSDSHYAEHISRGIETGMKIAADSGFRSIALFQNGEPTEIPIE